MTVTTFPVFVKRTPWISYEPPIYIRSKNTFIFGSCPYRVFVFVVVFVYLCICEAHTLDLLQATCLLSDYHALSISMLTDEQ